MAVLLTIAQALAPTLVSGFLGYFLGQWNQRRTERRTERRATYDEVSRLLADYAVYVAGGKPVRIDGRVDDELMRRSIWINQQVADRFSPRAFDVWRRAEAMIAAGGLRQDITQHDLAVAKHAALSAMHDEL